MCGVFCKGLDSFLFDFRCQLCFWKTTKTLLLHVYCGCFLYFNLQSCFVSLVLESGTGLVVVEFSLISVIYHVVTELTDKTCCSTFFFFFLAYISVISKERGGNAALKLYSTKLLCATTPHKDEKLTTRFLYAINWGGELAAVAFLILCPSFF